MTIHKIHKMANTYYAEKNDVKGKQYTVTATYLDDNSSEQKDSLENRIDNDNASEFKNDFTVKTDNDKIIRYIITKIDDNIYISSENDKPYYFINGKEISIEAVKNLDPNTIEKIEVIKGKSATKKYGKKVKNGIVFITLKKE